MMLNRCIFMGRLTKDPEIRYTQSAEPVAVARFSIAVDRNYQKGDNKVTDFFEVEAWRQKAEFAEKYLKKGQLICVEGSFQQYQWEDKNGNKRTGYRLAADNIYFAEGKKQDGEQNDQPHNKNNGGSQNANPAPAGFDPFANAAEEGFDPFADGADMEFHVN